ncbi:hypothetical protein FACS1894187_11160 [Synergistales bacterium]|nr:hypothetical protein FACS1894187_11160 [Synergistales bacterium]
MTDEDSLSKTNKNNPKETVKMSDNLNLEPIAEELNLVLSVKGNEWNDSKVNTIKEMFDKISSEISKNPILENLHDERTDSGITYLDLGDPYKKTIVYDDKANKFYAAPWSEFFPTRAMEKLAETLDSKLTEKTKEDPHTHHSHFVAEILEEVSSKIHGHGVEGILDENKNIDLQYVNMGDPYNMTILYDGNKNKFMADDWGSVMENLEQEHEDKPKSDRQRELAESICDFLAEEKKHSLSFLEIKDNIDEYAAQYDCGFDNPGEMLTASAVSYLWDITRSQEDILEILTEECQFTESEAEQYADLAIDVKTPDKFRTKETKKELERGH